MTNEKPKKNEIKTSQSMSYDFKGYYNKVEELVLNKQCSGKEQSEAKIGLTNLNFRKLKRIYEKVKIDSSILQKIRSLKDKQVWVLMIESWCADGAQNLPIIAKIVDQSKGKIALKILFRDENISLINNYLTQGAQAIPKLIARNSEGNDLFVWGPRPNSGQEIASNWKANKERVQKKDFLKELQKWYQKDAGQELQQEIESLLE